MAKYHSRRGLKSLPRQARNASGPCPPPRSRDHGQEGLDPRPGTTRRLAGGTAGLPGEGPARYRDPGRGPLRRQAA